MSKQLMAKTWLSWLLGLLFCVEATNVHADLVTGVAAFGSVNIPDLIYTPATGNVQIGSDGANILNFALDNGGGPYAGQFSGTANFADLDTNVGMPATTPPPDSTPTTIAWTSAKYNQSIGFGFSGAAVANLGNIFPTGLDLTGLQNLLQTQFWVQTQGGGELSFDLVVAVPELNAFLYLLATSMGVVFVACCRRLRRSAEPA